MRSLRLAVAALVAVATAAASTRAAADAPSSGSSGYSAHERAVIERALAAHHGELDPSPEGKIVESIELERLDVFGAEDVIPELFNVLHARTKPYVVLREVLQPVGEPWKQVLVDETARVLRGLPQLSLVVGVAMKGSAPGRVKLLIITRDVWSLRLQWDVQFLGGRFNDILINPTEQNLAGTHDAPSLLFEYRPLSFTTGAGYTISRFGDTHIGASANVNVLWAIGDDPARTNKGPEGSYGAVAVYLPLYHSQQQWSWWTDVEWRDAMTRRYENGFLKQFVEGAPNAPPDELQPVPFEYRTRSVFAGLGATRSFGWAYKNDIGVGYTYSRKNYFTEGFERFSPAAVAAFEQAAVPTGETRSTPYVQWRSYTANFFRTTDIETLGLQEDFRLGHDVFIELDPITRALGSTRTMLAVLSGAMYTLRLGDGLARASVEGEVDVQHDNIPDAVVDTKLGIVTPKLGFGRLVFNGRFTHRPANFLNKTEFLGGDTRLRGYPSSAFFGPDLVAMNMELRTRPLYAMGMAVGGVLFYDAGDTPDDIRKVHLKHSVGVGARLLLPFFDKLAYRLDFALPLDRSQLPASAPRVDFIFAVEQAFAFPELCNNSSGSKAQARQCP